MGVFSGGAFSFDWIGKNQQSIGFEWNIGRGVVVRNETIQVWLNKPDTSEVLWPECELGVTILLHPNIFKHVHSTGMKFCDMLWITQRKVFELFDTNSTSEFADMNIFAKEGPSSVDSQGLCSA